MAMDLMSQFRSKVSKIKDSGVNKSADFDVMYSTGFMSIDMLNGTVVHVKGNGRDFSYDSVGLVDGCSNSIIGRSGCGKSTLCTQIAGHIVKEFIEKDMPTGLFIDDIEGSLPWARKEFLLGLTPEQIDKYVDLRNSGITTENLFYRIKAIHDTKVENKKEYEYDTGYFDSYGNRIFKLVPTVYIIDSLPMLLPEDVAEDEEIKGQMVASSIAKSNTQLIKKISQLLKDANIMLFSVNHILDDINMGFLPKPAQISGLKQGERLPGGKTAIYLANNMIRLDDSNTLKKDKDYKIDGSIVNLSFVKSRTNVNKRSVPLIFNKTEGRFDNVLSLFHLLKTEGRFKGAGAYLYLDDCPDVKFGMGNFKDIIKDNKELQAAFAKECYNLLSELLSDTYVEQAKTDNASDNIADMFAGFSIHGNPEVAKK